MKIDQYGENVYTFADFLSTIVNQLIREFILASRTFIYKFVPTYARLRCKIYVIYQVITDNSRIYDDTTMIDVIIFTVCSLTNMQVYNAYDRFIDH